ncbi:hypothetical protein MTAT_20520 [Moorella thermoacetica]|uniref:Phage tail sheath protein n=1 Tax=Neomoorella thermoacetica TaxID=1525 RepID=A0AAC9MVR5_NEOTH|nr:hypothetical protein [Moorella thermoacetica]AOQ24707.1 Phage tail sheath protein [Moorella thermoacetica]TYL12810.1 hypothetical protein MTAT_20520 [Moorella thermoacetica]
MPEVSYETQYQAVVDVPVGQEVLFLGTAATGPVGIPLLCRVPDQAESIFGDCDLTRAFREAYAAGGRYIYLLRLDGPLSPNQETYDTLLSAALPSLQEVNFNIFHPVRFNFDRSQVLKEILDFAMERGSLGLETIFVLGVEVVEGDYDNQIDRLIQVSGGYNFFPSDDGTYLGRHFSVVASQAYYAKGSEIYQANCAATYAGMISALPPQVNLNNKNTGLFQALPSGRYEDLARAGYVTFCPTVRRGIAVYRAITMTPLNSDFRELVIYRTVAAVLARLRTLGERYLGQPQNMRLDGKTLEAIVDAELKTMVQEGMLFDYDFVLTYHALESRALLDLTLKPAFSVKEVKVRTTIFLV